jgi:hypothetical protein
MSNTEAREFIAAIALGTHTNNETSKEIESADDSSSTSDSSSDSEASIVHDQSSSDYSTSDDERAERLKQQSETPFVTSKPITTQHTDNAEDLREVIAHVSDGDVSATTKLTNNNVNHPVLSVLTPTSQRVPSPGVVADGNAKGKGKSKKTDEGVQKKKGCCNVM